MTFQLAPRKRLSGRMKIFLVFFAAAVVLAFLFVLSEVSIVFFFSPIIFAITFISVNRGLKMKKA